VLPGRGVLQESQDGAPPVRHERLIDSREEAAVKDAGVFGTRIFADVVGAKRE
jgi:hypothetical protein